MAIVPVPRSRFHVKSKTPGTGLVDVKLSETSSGKEKHRAALFPAAFTSVCTRKCATVCMGQYSSLNAAVIGISIDTPFSQEAWAKQEKIGITLASDLNKQVIKDYDVVFPILRALAIRRPAPRLSSTRRSCPIRRANADAKGCAQFQRDPERSFRIEVILVETPSPSMWQISISTNGEGEEAVAGLLERTFFQVPSIFRDEKTGAILVTAYPKRLPAKRRALGAGLQID